MISRIPRLLAAVAVAGLSLAVNAQSGYDTSGLDRFWEVADVLADDRDPTDAEWARLLGHPGYVRIERSGGRADAVRRCMPLVFKPSARGGLAAALEGDDGRVRRVCAHLEAHRDDRDEILAYAASLAGSDDVRLASERAAEYLPPGATDGETPPVYVLLFESNGFGGASIALDVMHLLDMEDEMRMGYLAHELHHGYMRRAERSWTDAADDAIVNGLDGLAVEGVASMLDKQPWLDAGYADRFEGELAGAIRAFRPLVERSDEVLAEVDRLLVSVARGETPAADAGPAIHRALPWGGHPTGLYMARTIEAARGPEALAALATDPVAFVLAYHEAASTRDDRFDFSPEAVALLRDLHGRGVPSAATEGVVAFENVTVVPMDAERVLPGHTVVVRGDRIAAVGPSVDVPPGATRIDGRGRWLVPGLADMHVHLIEESVLPLFLAAGVTTVRNLAGDEHHLDLRARLQSGEALGPTLYTAGPMLDGDPPAVSPGPTPFEIVRTAAEARQAVEAQHAAGYDFVKPYSALSPEAYAAIVETAGRLGMPYAGHIPRAVGLDAVLAGDPSSIEHAEEFIYTAFGFKLDEAQIDSVARAVAAADVWVTPTLSTYANFLPQIGKPAGLAVLLARPEVGYVAEGYVSFWRDQNRFVTRSDSVNQRNRYAFQLTLVRALHDAGVPMLTGTDTPTPVMVPGFSLWDDLDRLVEAGLSRYEALEAATAEPGRFVAATMERPGDPFGTITEGARADLVLLDGNPLDGFGALRDPVGVMVRGRWLPRADLDARLGAIRDRHAASD